MGLITIKNIRVFANHGCLPEETVIGSHYRVDLIVKSKLSQSAQSDDLKDTVDYVLLHQIVVEEMGVSSKLLETVGSRIINSIFKKIKIVQRVTVSVSKLNPPIGGDVEMISIKMTEKRKNRS